MNEEKAMLQINAEKISALTGFRPDEIAVVRNTTAKGTTDSELAYFLSVCKSVELNPFMKEIWCYKDNKGNVLVFAGRDGFLKRAHKRKDTLVASPEWWRHLRPYNKRRVAKAERKAGKVVVADGIEEPDETPKGLGLHNDPNKMRHEGCYECV